MKRLIHGLTLILVLLSTLFALHMLNAQTSILPGGIAVTNSWKVDDMLAGALELTEGGTSAEPSILQEKRHVSGFAITPGSADLVITQVSPETADDLPTYEFSFDFTPTELWFIVQDAENPDAELELAAVNVYGDVVVQSRPPIAITETLFNITPANLRLAVQALPGATPERVMSLDTWDQKVASFEKEQGPAPVAPDLYIQPTEPWVHIIDPLHERIMAIDPPNFSGDELRYVVYEASMYDQILYDPKVGSPEIHSRAPADTAGHPLREENFNLLGYRGFQPTVDEFLEDPNGYWRDYAGDSPINATMTLRYSLGSGDIPYMFDDPERFLVLDRESQVDRPLLPYDGHLRDLSNSAKLRVLTTVPPPVSVEEDFIPIEQVSSVYLDEALPSSIMKDIDADEDVYPTFPLGATLDVDPIKGEILGAFLTGGLEDTVARGSNFDPEGSNLPASFDPLFTSFHINRNFPIRIQELDIDSDGAVWMLTETLSDLDGQIWDNLYRLDLAATESLYGAFPRPQYPPPYNAGVRGDYNGDGDLGASNIVNMINDLNTYSDPNSNEDVDVLWRTDVDANGIFDTVDRDQITTIRITDANLPEPFHHGNFDGGGPLSFDGDFYYAMHGPLDDIDMVHDVEVVDLNHDGWPEVTALVTNSSGDFLWIFENDRSVTDPYIGTTYMVPLDFPARKFTWLDVYETPELDDDGIPIEKTDYPDVAMVNATSDSEGLLRIYETERKDEQYELKFRSAHSAGINPEQISTGFFNNDSRDDIIIGNNTGGDNLRVFTNEDNFIFSLQQFAVDKTPLGIDVGQIDVRNPLARNLIVASSDTDSLTIYENQSGSQVITDSIDLWNEPVDAFIARMVHDVNDFLSPSDIVVIETPGLGNNADIQLISVVNGQMSISRSIFIPRLINAGDGEVADFNLDGLDDVVLIGYWSSSDPWNNTGIANFAIYASSATNATFNVATSKGLALLEGVQFGIFGDVEVADLDNDGDPDLIFSIVQISALHPARNGIYFFENTQEGARSPLTPGEQEDAEAEEEF